MEVRVLSSALDHSIEGLKRSGWHVDLLVVRQHLSLGTLTRAWADPRVRRPLAIGSAAGALMVLGISVLHFTEAGWPLSGADPRLAGVAGGFFILAYVLKAYGWQRLFRPTDRPKALALAAAGGAASVGGAALPGRFDDVVRIAVVRRARTSPAGVSTLCLSLFMLGLIDTAALMPFSMAAALDGSLSPLLRGAMGVVAFAGVGAAVVVGLLPRMGESRRLVRFRLVRWIVDQTTPIREAGNAWLLVVGSWTVRVVGLYFLLVSLGISDSFLLAVAFLCAASASAAIPISPAGGAVTQAGAGAAILIAAGIPFTQAAAFAVAAQGLYILAGAAVLGFAAFVHGAGAVGSRFALQQAS